MATTDQDLSLTGTTSIPVLIGASTAFIIQNTSNRKLKFKVKDSASNGGEIPPLQKYEFDYDIDLWVDDAPDANAKTEVYLVRD